MKIINYQGKDIEVEEVEVLTSKEKWNEYQLADGSVLQTKTVLIKVARALHERTPEGDALYIAQSQNIVKVRTTK